jgi:hypothetical protein
LQAEKPEATESAGGAEPHEGGSDLQRRAVAVTAPVCLAFVVLADFLFYGHPLGWTIGGFGLSLLGALLLLEGRFPRSGPALVVMLGTASLFLLCFEQPAVLTVLLGGLGLASTALLAREGWTPDPVAWMKRWTLFGAVGWTRAFADLFRPPSEESRGEGERTRATGRRLKNWLLPLLLGALFLGLFALANPIIARWLATAARWVGEASWHMPPFGRVVFWLLVLLGTWALLRYRTGVEPARGGESELLIIEDEAFFTPGLLLRCLVVLNALFAVQTVMDVRYLWGGAALPAGMTYAEYAHRGAYPLVLAALLAGLFVLVAFRRDSGSPAMRWARGLVYLWLAQNVLLVLSAGWRLRLYVGAYSLTRLRTAAAVWMLLVVCGLIWIAARLVLRRTGRWLVGVNLVTALAVLYFCCFVNFDGLIARFNVAHSAELGGAGPSLDVRYLEGLGPEALPALLRFLRQVEEAEPRRNARRAVGKVRRELRRKLRDWRGWTLRRRRLSSLISGPEPASAG